MQKHVRTMWCELKFLLEGQCYRDIQMKAYITKLTAELKSDNVECRNKI